LPEQFFIQGNYDEDGYEYEEDDDLGYYEDGVKRTLTDTQISIFRHSEIQRILWIEAGELSGPISPEIKRKKQQKSNTRTEEEKAALDAARARKDRLEATRREEEAARKAAARASGEPEPEPVKRGSKFTPLGTGKKERKIKKKGTKPSVVAPRAARAWKPRPDRRMPALRRQNTSSPEPESKSEHRSEKILSLKRKNTSSPEPKREPRNISNKVKEQIQGESTAENAEVAIQMEENGDRHDPQDFKSDDGDFTYRRLARDEDSVPNISIQLDY
jgi:hypothetical protein